MITRLTDVPLNLVAFRATGEVTKDDYENVVFPSVKELLHNTDVLNYLMIIDTLLKNFTIGAWLEDMLLGLKEIAKWNRVAILTDSHGLNKFTDAFSVLVPGEFKGFMIDEYDEAVKWTSGH
jgi:hypothetical protein